MHWGRLQLQFGFWRSVPLASTGSGMHSMSAILLRHDFFNEGLRLLLAPLYEQFVGVLHAHWPFVTGQSLPKSLLHVNGLIKQCDMCWSLGLWPAKQLHQCRRSEKGTERTQKFDKVWQAARYGSLKLNQNISNRFRCDRSDTGAQQGFVPFSGTHGPSPGKAYSTLRETWTSETAVAVWHLWFAGRANNC